MTAEVRDDREAVSQGAPAAPGNTAVLDAAHLGDIRGAFGTIGEHDANRPRSWRRRLLALAVIMGPGLIVMVGDNDAGGVATYAQAGQNYGTSLLWTLVFLIPVLIVNQEMVVRLGAVTGVGHGRLIFERFGRFWGWFSVGDLFILNFLTIATEFIGISLGAPYFGVTPYLAVPLAGVLLIGITVTGRFETWERLMFVILFGNLLIVPLVILSHPNLGQVARDLVVPGMQNGVTSTGVLLIIAIVGTTVAPWQLFFQQSNVVDKRITPRWIPYERADTVIGAFVVVIGATAIMVTTAFAFQHTRLTVTSSMRATLPPVSLTKLVRRPDRYLHSCSSTPRSSARVRSRSRRRTHSATPLASGTRCTARGARRSRSMRGSPPWSYWPRESCSSPERRLG